ncbi:hypothetical protein [Streptomyces sp. NPDC014676]|uniref:hypothetical protein n=1 Tax=Streptomyces sp. NPDC014676 TaxID=3364879 RepID=UPI0036FAE067
MRRKRMIKRFFRRRRTTSATPLRVALHGTAVSLSSAGFGYGTTFIGADAPSAAGLGLSAFTVLLTLFPLPSRKNSKAPDSEVAERTSGATEQEEVEGNDALPSDPRDSSSRGTASNADPALMSDDEEPMLSAVDTEPKPATGDEKRTLPVVDTTDPKSMSPINGMQQEPNVPVLVWEPRLEIKPQVTVHPTVFKDASGTGTVSALPTAEPDEGLTRSDEAS